MKYHALIVLAVFTAVSCASSAPELTSTADMSTMVAAQKEEKPLFETVYIPKLLRQTVYFETDFVKYQIEYTYNEDLLA
ncbi:MAG: hypothetical protein JXB03_00925, partial [Spirochaetales bacterium]|nr:hypothetical protein [Spirochaetales bacterium]